jgi:transposase
MWLRNLEKIMPWTEITRPNYDRTGQRYASDSTDVEWALVEPFMPPTSKLWRARRTDMRSVRDAIQYVAATGCQWAMLPKDFPPFTTVQYYFYLLRNSGLLDILNEALVGASRVLAGRDVAPTAGVIDSQSVKTTQSGGPGGYDAGKKTKGRKRHIVTDTDGNLLGLVTHTADIQDRDGTPGVIMQACESFPNLTHLFADGGYAGEKLKDALADIDGPSVEIVKRPPGVTGFVVIARRWVDERTFSWLRLLARTPGSDAAAAWQRIGKLRSRQQMLGFSSPQ